MSDVKIYLDKTLADIAAGGPRSGNYGHDGRPGVRGGSVPRSVSTNETTNTEISDAAIDAFIKMIEEK